MLRSHTAVRANVDFRVDTLTCEGKGPQPFEPGQGVVIKWTCGRKSGTAPAQEWRCRQTPNGPGIAWTQRFAFPTRLQSGSEKLFTVSLCVWDVARKRPRAVAKNCFDVTSLLQRPPQRVNVHLQWRGASKLDVFRANLALIVEVRSITGAGSPKRSGTPVQLGSSRANNGGLLSNEQTNTTTNTLSGGEVPDRDSRLHRSMHVAAPDYDDDSLSDASRTNSIEPDDEEEARDWLGTLSVSTNATPHSSKSPSLHRSARTLESSSLPAVEDIEQYNLALVTELAGAGWNSEGSDRRTREPDMDSVVSASSREERRLSFGTASYNIGGISPRDDQMSSQRRRHLRAQLQQARSQLERCRQVLDKGQMKQNELQAKLASRRRSSAEKRCDCF
eukprot:TRINITY_DN80845_c0_g1_i1.p1 TRINITY_DN80845_c0_g1~~TRINITY_DN80845_c0_g1_i1.p1  ORF type:complete len:390 (+),score=31.36 TRINITY_DN80845_c0_g1_i1:60-1229(+)